MKNLPSHTSSLMSFGISMPVLPKWNFNMLIVPVVLLFSAIPLFTQTIRTVLTEMSAEQAYEQGFASDVMKSPSSQGIRIADRVLFENDGPGAGRSEKGAYLEPIYAGKLANKQFYLVDPRAKRAHVVVFMTPSSSQEQPFPYYLVVNGTRIPGSAKSWHQPEWQWVEIPVSLLKKGLNDVAVGCDAPRGKGWDLLFAREDEYNDGGGKFTYNGNTATVSSDQIRPVMEEAKARPGVKNNPTLSKTEPRVKGYPTFLSKGFIIEKAKTETSPSTNSFMYFHPASQEIQAGLQPIKVGATSEKSLDGGKTWIEGKLGPNSDISGEYTIRLNLERFKSKGILDSPPIDLWSGTEDYPTVKPLCKVDQLQMDVHAFIPEGTEVIWQMRMANTNDMMDNGWGEWQDLGSGGNASFVPVAKDKRYLQWRAILKSENLLFSPTVKKVNIQRRLSYIPPPSNTYYVTDAVNPAHRYSSFRMSFENVQEGALKSLQQRLNIHSLIKDAHGDFEKINILRHFVSGLWFHANPFPEYPEWNANKILDRNDRVGAGGMCIQFATVFMQALQSLGYNVRHINIFAHESVEVYVDELGTWVHVDPESLFDSYEFNSETGSPLCVLEQHKFFLKELGFSASNPIDWSNPEPWTIGSKNVESFSVPIGFSTFTDFVNNPNQPPPQHKLAGSIRFIPRNDFLSRPVPRPLTQGGIAWPWNGYINWYDEATPRRLEYAMHTDRLADFYPTLNRVEYTATYDKTEGQININMITVTPNFETFEINIDGQGWQPSNDSYTWQLRPAALNKVEMRTRNSGGAIGKPSSLTLFWHYREPFKPRVKNK